MAVRKIAISVPEDVLDEVDRLAKQTHTTRSGFITRVLSEVSRARGQAEIRDRLNRFFDSTELREEQTETSSFYLKAAEPGNDGEW